MNRKEPQPLHHARSDKLMGPRRRGAVPIVGRSKAGGCFTSPNLPNLLPNRLPNLRNLRNSRKPHILRNRRRSRR
jgi:hypothetical protein